MRRQDNSSRTRWTRTSSASVTIDTRCIRRRNAGLDRGERGRWTAGSSDTPPGRNRKAACQHRRRRTEAGELGSVIVRGAWRLAAKLADGRRPVVPGTGIKRKGGI